MKTLFRNKTVMAMMVVGLVAIFLTAGGVIAGPPAHSVGGAAYITLDPSEGFPGDLINVCGYSFTAEAWVDIYYCGTWIGDILTDGDGYFEFGFQVPESCAGDHGVLAEDGYGSTAYASFTVLSRINYQGQLTDNGGNPLSGTYDMEFRFYESATGYSQAGSTITRNNVEVTNGLFSVKLDVDRYQFERYELWLDVTVEGETLSPRQEILPVPYALSLKPGAVIRGEDNARSVLTAYNRGSGSGLTGQSEDDRGVVGYGVIGVMGESEDNFNAGVLGWNHGSGPGVDAYSESGPAISARGTGIIESTADSYIFVPPSSLVTWQGGDVLDLWYEGNGAVRISRPGTVTPIDTWIIIPVTVPGVLYGQEVTVEELTIYYVCSDGTKNYISMTYMWKQTDADSSDTLVDSTMDRKSSIASSYTLTPTGNNVLSSNEGILSIGFLLHFEDNTNYIQIGGARLRLSHS